MEKPIVRQSLIRTFFIIALALTCLAPNPASAQLPYAYFTLAGKAGSAGFTNLTGPAARFNDPFGVTVDSLGYVYVADTANQVIRKIAPGASVSTFAGIAGSNGFANGAAATAEFSEPSGIAVDISGNVYVADWGNHVIRKITLGQVSTLAGLAGKPGWADGNNSVAQFNHPAAIAVDSLDNIYVADQGNDAIRMITSAGVVSTLAGTPGVTGFSDGISTNSQFNLPSGIAYYSSGILAVSDTGNNTIREVALSGGNWTVTTIAGSPGQSGTNDLPGASARFSTPMGLAVAAGFIAVADFGNSTIRYVTLGGQVSTQAGSPQSSGTASGPGFAVLFDWPAAVAFDADTNIYVADSGNDAIREGSPVIAPIITTQPTPQTGVPDGSVTFSIVATGVPPLLYTWSYNGEEIANGVDNAIEIDDLEVGDDGNISVEVTSPYGSVVSSNAALFTAVPDEFITWAGSPTNAFGFKDGAGSDALFDYPGALTSDTNGNIFVADSYNNSIREIVPSGLTDCAVTTLAGDSDHQDFADGEGTNAYFDNPFGLCIDTNGTIYVTDTYNYAIRQMKFNGSNWDVTTIAGNPGVQGTTNGAGTNALFAAPVGVTVGLGGNLFVADSDAGSVHDDALRQVAPEGEVTTLTGSELISGGEFAGEGTYGLSSPEGLVADDAGNLYVADNGNNQIFKVSTNTATTNWTAVNYAGAQSDYGGTNDGSEYNAQFNQPYDVAGDGHGIYYVADTGNNTIRKIATDQSVSTIGGLAGFSGSSDGVGTNALFNIPLGVCVDPNGILYVADSQNNTIRKQLPDLLIAVQPQDQSVHVNSNITFNVTAASTSDLTYQWLKNSNTITGANESSYTLSGAQTSDAASYSVAVSNATTGIFSSAAKLTVQIPPIIVTNPVAHMVTNGAKVTLTVSAIGTGPLTYQWLLDGVPIPGQTKTNLVITGVSTNNIGEYSVAINSAVSDITSTNVPLTLVLSTNAPQIQSITHSASSITFTFTSAANESFQIQVKNNLAQSIWVDLGSPITATNSTVSVSEAITNSHQFYRVLLLP
ncbi:MAG TPA: immunoglobulin domain-containing protein [Verrucomicrobiae bacterium]